MSMVSLRVKNVDDQVRVELAVGDESYVLFSIPADDARLLAVQLVSAAYEIDGVTASVVRAAEPARQEMMELVPRAHAKWVKNESD